MKKSIRIWSVVIVASVIMMSCEKNKVTDSSDIIGTYQGTLTSSATLKSTSFTPVSEASTAVISDAGDGQIQLHCFGEDFDTTMVLDYFNNNDSIMICLTDSDFENIYGHTYGHMSGGMMGSFSNSNSEWMQHMETEHQDGDVHFGGFDMINHTFHYSFGMMDQSSPYYMNFQGQKTK